MGKGKWEKGRMLKTVGPTACLLYKRGHSDVLQ